MINLLITGDCLSMKKLADCILTNPVAFAGTVIKNELEEGHDWKISGTIEQMLVFFHECGKHGIDLNVRTLYNNTQEMTAVFWTI